MYQGDNGNGGVVALLFVAAAGALAYLGWKKFQGIESKLEEKPAPVAEAKSKAKPKPRPVQLSPVVKNSIRDGIAAGIGLIIGSEGKYKTPGDADFASKFADKILVYAGNLQRADREASEFLSNLGTTAFINTTLTTINALPDNDFRQAYKAWKELRATKDLYSTNLYKAKLDTHQKVDFFNRVYSLNIA
ncbi:hypothetical protein IDJ77_11215 [Mucilaginibacter sp. ZT4R22]|uniref:Uncharacterized protein n=1 Tax=Mucilaginibacter pankratovii TaxID=2772110 RepID=A0ABR7WPW9_9SPHI|nr:hypothetical protein [Mucilaginibacter pankratovii]MBD1364378.1 hypothetical protein [Mucilaginibacter pankratovii]